MKLLIVEDEEDLALGLKRGLRKNGYEVDWTGGAGKGWIWRWLRITAASCSI